MSALTTFVVLQARYRSYEPTKRVSAISSTDFFEKMEIYFGTQNHDFKEARDEFNLKKMKQ